MLNSTARHLAVPVTLTLALLTALVLAPIPSAAENWPGFRGPTGQGLSSERRVPLHWSATSNVAWKVEVPAQGWSSPAVHGRRVFLTGTTENGARCHVLCFDRDSGRLLWNQPVLEQVPLRKEDKNSHATPTPVVDSDRVYAVFGSGAIVALRHDGSLVWTNTEVSFYSRHGLGASPILHGNLLIMPFDGSNRVREAGQWPNNSKEEQIGWRTPWDKAEIVALDRKTGQRVWTARRGLSRIAHATPIVHRVHGQDQLLSIAGDAVQGFHLKTGERLWSVYCQGEGLVPSPVVAGDLLIAASGFEKTTLRAFRPPARGETNATIVWEQKKGVPSQPSLLHVAPYVYAITDGGIASCYEPATGNLVWQERVGGNHSASPIHADGHIFFLSEAGETTVIKAGPTFEIVARNAIGEKCQASLAVSNRRFFLRTEKHLFCLAAATPASSTASSKPTPAAKPAKTVRLFDGRTLAGWIPMHGGQWTVEDGAIVGRHGSNWAAEPEVSGSWLRTERQYSNFTFEFEYNIGTNGNSGVFLRSALEKNPAYSGHEMQVLADHGRPPGKGSTGALYDVVAPAKNMSRPAGEWNQARVTCTGRRIQIELNGEPIVDYVTDRLTRGYLGLQVHDERSVVKYRNLQITER